MDTQQAEIITVRPHQDNPVSVFLASLGSQTSRISQLSALNVIARKLGGFDAYSFEWETLDHAKMTAIQAWLVQDYAPRTVRRYMSGVIGVLSEARHMHLITADEFMDATDLKKIRGQTIAGRMLTMDEIRALLATCQVGPRVRGLRDMAIISLLVGCGLRRAEITTLKMNDYDLSERRLVVTGKGSKERYAYPQGGVLEALNQWLKERGERPGPIFPVLTMNDTVQWHGMSVMSVWTMLLHRQQAAGISHFTPHDLRRTFISNLLDLPGVDIATASKLAGHSDPGTTAKYDRRSDRTAEHAAGLVEIPFKARGKL